MVRLIALILSVSAFLFTSALADPKDFKNGSVVDFVLSGARFSSQKKVLHARNYDRPQRESTSSKSSSESRHRRRYTDKSHGSPKLVNITGNQDYLKTSAQSGSLGSLKSVFDIHIPGDPRFVGKMNGVLTSGKSVPWTDPEKNEQMSLPGDFLKRLGSIPKVSVNSQEENPTQRLEIQVSHSTHIFKLLSHAKSTEPNVLYQCKIGLGAPEFPTPVGVYYVTHIYDQNPWWIPPANRAWAAGDSPSKRVYGGTMAPLLKKRPVKTKKKDLPSEDRVEGQVKLEDYGYRFHGTNAPRSIGRNQSHGCVRMLSDDARRVAAIIEDKVGIAQRKESENGSFAVLKAPVRLNLIK